jgi:riboflavin kinase/FMN adenylyltransferase
MHIWHGLESINEQFSACTLAIGMFDGIHVGHQTLISAAVADAKEHGRAAAVLTFDRHPMELIAPDRTPGYLSTLPQRELLFEELGVDHLVIARFDERFRELSPEGFLRFVVKAVLGADAAFVGFDFRFGCDHAGDVAYLKDSQNRLDLEVNVLDPVLVDGEKASSSRIRALLTEGKLDNALIILGHPFILRGMVVEGQKLGRKLGFPTANIDLERAQVIPKDGIYATRVEVGGKRLMGACSIGLRPTVDGKERTIEVYLLDFDGNLYGKMLDLDFVARLRDEAKFGSLEDLVEQIGKDVEDARDILLT